MAERQGRNVMVSTFRVPDEYERARLEAERRAALAQMLEAQAYQPLDVRQPAPIAPSQGLAKVLKSYLGAYEKRKAREAEEKAKGEEQETAEQIMGRLMGRELPEFEPDEEKRAANEAAEAERIAGIRADIEPSIARQRETGQLEEVMPTARYIRDPEGALALADTPAGQAALKNRPVMAAKLAELLKTPEKPTTKTMEVGGQLVNVTDGVATPVTTSAGTPFTVPATPTELRRLIAERDALPPDSPLRPTYDARIKKESEGGPSTVIDLRPDKTTNAYTTELSQIMARQDAEAIAFGEQAIPQIESSFRVRDLLRKNPITGTAAEARLGLERALATAGFGKGDRATVTENLAAELGKTTLAAIRTSGLGSGQGFTDNDRKFLERAAAGNIELTQENLEYLAELNERAGRARIEQSNRVRARVRQLPQFEGLPNMFPDIVAPPAYDSQAGTNPIFDEANAILRQQGLGN